MPSIAAYRSYEVLVEETAENHKTRDAGKTKKDFKPHYENTCRALRVTHELFQDAVCYYILCFVGLVKNERDKDGEPINRMWEYLRNDPKTHAVLTRLTSRYSEAPFYKMSTVAEFLSKTYGWLSAESDTRFATRDGMVVINSIQMKIFLAASATQLLNWRARRESNAGPSA